MAEDARNTVQAGWDDWFLQAPLDRRQALWGLGLTGLATAMGITVLTGIPEGGPMNTQDTETALIRAQQNQADLESAQALAQSVGEGMRHTWASASVWPGLAIVPPSVPLFATPSLHPGTKLDWPGAADRKLIVQRPFLITASLQLNGAALPDGIHRQIMGGWLPKSEQIAYFDRWTYKNRILLPNVSRNKVYDEVGAALGETVTLEPAASIDGLTWRYLLSEYVNSSYYPAEVFNRVCGRSILGNVFEVNSAIDNYSGSQYPVTDLVRLPETVHG